MKLRKLVCPYDPALLNSFRERQIAVRVDSPSLVREAADAIINSTNNLICVILDSAQPVASVPFEDSWNGIPLLLMATAVGEFRNIVSKLGWLRNPSLRIYLNATNENIRDVHILSSIGVNCSILFEKEKVDWEALSDLMTYALCARVPHAPIDPFDYISRHLESSTHLKWGAVFLDDPGQYFHLDKEKNVALSRNEVIAKQFIGHIDDVEKTKNQEVEKRSDDWSRTFIENGVCATCVGFKLCLGKFLPEDGKADGCSAFFSEMFDVLGERESLKGNVWQL